MEHRPWTAVTTEHTTQSRSHIRGKITGTFLKMSVFGMTQSHILRAFPTIECSQAVIYSCTIDYCLSQVTDENAECNIGHCASLFSKAGLSSLYLEELLILSGSINHRAVNTAHTVTTDLTLYQKFSLTVSFL